MHLMPFGSLPSKISSIDVEGGRGGVWSTVDYTYLWHSYMFIVYASRILTNSHCFVLLLRNTNRSPVACGNFTPPLPFYCCIPPTPDVYNVWFHRVHIMKRERTHYCSCCCEVLVGVSAGAREATTEQCRMDRCRMSTCKLCVDGVV